MEIKSTNTHTNRIHNTINVLLKFRGRKQYVQLVGIQEVLKKLIFNEQNSDTSKLREEHLEEIVQTMAELKV